METPPDMGSLDADAQTPAATDLIKDTTTPEFVKDVIEESAKQPVLVDFWAPWCGPCKQLTPILEKLVKQAEGAVKLVKMNIDDDRAVAAQLGVQSIPAVFAFKDGRPVDAFMGALPEGQLKTFIEKIAGAGALSGIDDVLETAKTLYDEDNIEDAKDVYLAVHEEDPENVEAIAGLAHCYLVLGDIDKAEEVLALTPQSAKTSNAITSAEAALALAKKGAGTDQDLSKFHSALEANPDDHQARFDLALALNGAGQKREAMETLFELMERARNWNENAAQKQLLEFFSAWGADDENAVEGRRRLSSILFA